jgi:hypothetical protein
LGTLSKIEGRPSSVAGNGGGSKEAVFSARLLSMEGAMEESFWATGD